MFGRVGVGRAGGRWPGGRASSEVYLLANLFEKRVHNAVKRLSCILTLAIFWQYQQTATVCLMLSILDNVSRLKTVLMKNSTYWLNMKMRILLTHEKELHYTALSNRIDEAAAAAASASAVHHTIGSITIGRHTAHQGDKTEKNQLIHGWQDPEITYTIELSGSNFLGTMKIC